MYNFVRPLLFRLDPERAHALTLSALRLTGALPPVLWGVSRFFKSPPKPVSAFGLTFKNPVGLAAGYDKDGLALRGLGALGFGHIEIGTVTPRPQPGNPPPRLFRLVEDEAVINRLGFPGKGADYVAGRLLPYGMLRDRRGGYAPPRNDIVIGVNLGKNKDTPLEEAANDYLMLMRRFMVLADYLTINVSSPNTVGLRRLQGRALLEALLDAVARGRRAIAAGQAGNAPILVKLAPDLTDEELDDALGVILDKGMDGLIVTNTTLGRQGLRSGHQGQGGGLSGAPLRVRSEAVLRQAVRRVDGRIPVVSAGGIMSPEDAKRRLDMGAALVQVYTGLVYRGPGLVQEIIQSL
jgi:dihydroorotate dehydrogenase